MEDRGSVFSDCGPDLSCSLEALCGLEDHGLYSSRCAYEKLFSSRRRFGIAHSIVEQEKS